MKITIGTLFVLLFAFFVHAQEVARIDKLRTDLFKAMDSHSTQRDLVREAFNASGVSSNEFTQVLMDLLDDPDYGGGHSHVSSWLMGCLSGYGTTNALPRLEMAFKFGGRLDMGPAIPGIFRLSGCSSTITNSVVSWSDNPTRENCLRLVMFYEAIRYPHVTCSLSEEGKARLRELLCAISVREVHYPIALDRAIRSLDPTYAHSKRRRTALRTALPNVRGNDGLKIEQILSELDALPENELTE